MKPESKYKYDTPSVVKYTFTSEINNIVFIIKPNLV